ncbi:MAG: rhomboid family intramembrane serine protease [Bdellovibrionales bacterium]|nr:rhomboid family intramembrane serine protease [Bdellovibrionales bacterium]
MTWMIVIVNVLVFVLITIPSQSNQKIVRDKLNDSFFLQVQGRYFSQFVVDHPEFYGSQLKQIAQFSLDGSIAKSEVMGGLAIRDAYFMKWGDTYDFGGDVIANQRWMSSLQEMNEARQEQPSHNYGVSFFKNDGISWITYQFVHSGFTHLAANMVYLLIFGALLEMMIGSFSLLLIYLGGGAVGAGVFLLFSGATPIPLIGASGAVSALMGFFCVLLGKRNVAYLYFLFIPSKEYMGLVYLPAWVTFLLWILSDLAGVFGNMSEFGGIAYTAHIGGQLSGAGVGLALLAFHYWKGDLKNWHRMLPPTRPLFSKVYFVQEPTRRRILSEIR